MAIVFKQITAEIDNRTNDLIHGYIKDVILKQNECSTIPPLIVYTIVAYYWITEYFHVIPGSVSLSDNKKKLTSISFGRLNTSFGRTIIDSTCHNIYKWKLKIINSSTKRQTCVMIGISTASDSEATSCFTWSNTAMYYAYNGYNGMIYRQGIIRTRSYGKTFTGGDIVGIDLNLSKKQISFTVNDKDQGVAFETIKSEEDLKYRLAISFYETDDSVELMSFYEIKQNKQ